MFDPTEAPGPSFTDLLRRVGLDPFSPIAGPAGAAPFEIRHATTIVALRYREGVVMAGDRRATAGSSIAHRAMDKVHPADRHSGVAIAGAAGPAAPAIATPLCLSAGWTLSMARWAIEDPAVARRSPAITTPSR